MPQYVKPKHAQLSRYKPVNKWNMLTRCDSCDAVIFRRKSITRLLVFTPAKQPGHYGSRMTARLCGFCARRERMVLWRLRRPHRLGETITCDSCKNTVPIADALRRRVRMTRMRPIKHGNKWVPHLIGPRKGNYGSGRGEYKFDLSYVTGYSCKPCANAELIADAIPNPILAKGPPRVYKPGPRIARGVPREK